MNHEPLSATTDKSVRLARRLPVDRQPFRLAECRWAAACRPGTLSMECRRSERRHCLCGLCRPRKTADQRPLSL